MLPHPFGNTESTCPYSYQARRRKNKAYLPHKNYLFSLVFLRIKNAVIPSISQVCFLIHLYYHSRSFRVKRIALQKNIFLTAKKILGSGYSVTTEKTEQKGVGTMCVLIASPPDALGGYSCQKIYNLKFTEDLL